MPRAASRLSLIVIVALCLQPLGLAQHASPADETALRAVAEALFAAYASKDLEGFMGMWSANSSELASRRKTTQELFAANERIEVKSLTVGKVKVKGDKASLRATVEMSAAEAKTGKPAGGFGRMNRALDFVKEEGRWKVWREAAAEEDLAAALIAATTDDERGRLLAADKELITAELWKALTRQGARQYLLSNYPQALIIDQLSLSIAEHIGDKEGIGQALNDLGVVHYSQGNYGLGLEYLHKSLMLRNELGDKQKMAISLTNLGSIYGLQGNYSLASEHYRKALEQFEATGHTLGMGTVLNSIGNTYEAQGNYDLALKNYERALGYFEALGHKAGTAVSLNNTGIIYQKQGDYAKALDYLQKSLKIKEAIGNKAGVAASLHNMAEVYRTEGKYDLALDHFQQSLAQYEAVGEPRGRALTLGAIAMVYYLKGDYAKALQFSERATTIALQIDARDLLWEIRTTVGRAYRGLNQPIPARQAFEEAIAIIEGLRAWVAGGEQEQQRFFENRISPYHEMIALLVDQGKPGEALGYAEQAKARVLLDVLRRGKVDVTKAMTAKEQEQETNLKSALISLNTQMSRERQRAQSDQARLTNLQAQLNKARLEYESFQTSLYAAHPDLKARRGEVRSATPEEAATLLPETGSALIEYVVTEENTYLFVATKEVGVKPATLSWKAHKVVIKRKHLADQVESFRQQLAKRDLTFKEYASRLYDLLLKPAQTQLDGKHTLVIVPDGPLWELPFQALQDTQRRYLVEQHAISYAPSLTVLREMAKLRQKVSGVAESPTLLAFGNPALSEKSIEPVEVGYRDGRLKPLPEAEREVKSLARLYGGARSKVYTGLDAREERLKLEAGRHRILQLAAHALLNDASPMYSHVVLAQGAEGATDDGMLEAWEMMNLDLNADLVVLSACETGRGRVAAGEGVIGMTWALFVAGSPTIVVSLWKVESLTTTELMLEFHRNLLSARRAQSPLSKAQALQRAAIRMLTSRDHRHPFYWAGFVVVGDGG